MNEGAGADAERGDDAVTAPLPAAVAMTKVMSVPGTMLRASPAAAKARKAGSGGRSSIPAMPSISEVVVDFSLAFHV